MKKNNDWVSRTPILKTLTVCPKDSKKHARIELYWTIGFALLALPIVAVIVIFTRPISEVPSLILDVVGRGELMIYAATVCGAALYSLRHGIVGPIPDSLQQRVTPPGTLSVSTALLLGIAVISYVVRRMGELNHIEVNDNLLNAVSVIVLGTSLLFAYVVLSLKFALNSGAAHAPHEQTAEFSKMWEAERDS